MTREEMARVLSDVIEDRYLGAELTDLEADKARFALAALLGPWVKTTDRLPTKEDADDEGKVTALITGTLTGKLLSLSLYYASVTAESADYFLPMPKLPEVEE